MSIWRMLLTAPTFTFPNLRWNKFLRLPSGKSTVLFLGVSRFLRNSSAEDTKAFSAIIGITAGLKFRFRSSGTNCVNLRQYAIRSCLRFPANKFTPESGKTEHGSLGRWKTEKRWIPSFISLRRSWDDFNSDLSVAGNVIAARCKKKRRRMHSAQSIIRTITKGESNIHVAITLSSLCRAARKSFAGDNLLLRQSNYLIIPRVPVPEHRCNFHYSIVVIIFYYQHRRRRVALLVMSWKMEILITE